jgi:HSP20 family protein
MNRLFSGFFEAENGTARRWAPAMDVVEAGDHIVLKVDLPGVAEDDVRIEVRNNVLTISGERKAEHEESRNGFHRVERSFGSFYRSMALPQGVDADSIEASFDAGVLEVRVPKPQEPKAHRIAIGKDSGTVEGKTKE